MTEKELAELARQERNKYHREWRAKNPDKVKARNRKYWEHRALQAAEAAKEASNREGEA